MRAATRSSFLIAAAMCAAAPARRAAAQSARPLRLISFFSTTTMPIWATKMAPDVAAAVFPSIVDPVEGLFRNGRIDAAGMETVLMLRGKFGVPRLTLTDAKKYYDERYYLQAARGRA